MIIVFPMLVSRAVSENAIPGIAKTIENYIIVNYQDMIINNSDIKKQSKMFGKISYGKGNLFIKESEDLLEAIPPDSTSGTKDKKQDSKDSRDKLERDKFIYKKKQDAIKAKQDEIDRIEKKLEKIKDDKKKDEKEKEEEAKKELEKKEEKEKEIERLAKNARADVKLGDTKSISLEPTYITVDKTDRHGNKSASFIGVKVIPIRVKADVKLSHLLLYDTKLKSLTALSLKIGRTILKKSYGLFDRWATRFRIGGLTASGDPRRDIIMGRTGMGKGSQTFIVLSKQEDVDETFLDNIQKINRLFNMGWGNFVIADDIGRSAYFCMRKFKGMCSAVPYAMMYQYLGQTKAYETMEDARKASSSIFKVGKRFSKVLGEWRTTDKLHKYSQLNEDYHNE